MAILSKQIGWSQESNLLWELLKKVDRLNGIVASGNQNTAITFAPSTSQDAFGRLRTSSPLTLFDSSHRFDDNDLWSTATATSGAAVFNVDQGLVDLNVTAASGSSVIRAKSESRIKGT